MIGVMVPSVFADSDYSKIKVKYASTHILEFEKYNVIRTAFTIENDDIQKFQTYNTYLTADDTIHYEISTSYDIDEIGDKTCPNTDYDIEINPGLEEEYVFCFQVPKSFSNNFTLKFMSSNSERCAEKAISSLNNQYIDPCQESTYPLSAISNPTKISYDSLLKTFVKNFDNVDANVSNVELMEFRDLNVLIMTVSIFNKGSSELIGWNIDATAKSISGLEFDTTYYTDINCDSGLENINPGITKTFKLCFDVPKNETAFDLALRTGFGLGGSGSLSDCDGMWADCNELFINIIVPEPIVESTPVVPTPVTPTPVVPTPVVPTPVAPTPVAPTPVAPTGIASFVDQSKDPQHYIDRYNNEPTYKEWFDENYSQYSSIYEAVGLEKPQIASSSNNMSYSLYNDPEKNFSLKYPSTWLVEQVPLVSTVIFSDNSNWSVQAIVYDLGIIPGIDTQSAEDRYYGTYGGESLNCKLMTFESTGEICYDILPLDHGTSTLESGEKIHTLGYTSTREFEGYNTPIQFFTLISDFTRDNHVWELEFTYDTSMTSFNEKQALILKDMLNSFTITPVPIVEPTPVASTGIASFVDQSKDPQHYIDRYNNEATYKEWFDENYSQYSSIYQAVGLEEPVVGYTPEPTVEVASTPNCGTGTQLVNGICKVIQTEEKSSKGGGCLIATATYGSEMATEVQQLRELRDNQLLNTESGIQFMGTFNDIYYSFSPTIADMEREHPMFKEAVKLAITPMISTLSLMENADSESEVLSIGISVIMLNLGMYLGVPAIIVVGIKRKF